MIIRQLITLLALTLFSLSFAQQVAPGAVEAAVFDAVYAVPMDCAEFGGVTQTVAAFDYVACGVVIDALHVTNRNLIEYTLTGLGLVKAIPWQVNPEMANRTLTIGYLTPDGSYLYIVVYTESTKGAGLVIIGSPNP